MGAAIGQKLLFTPARFRGDLGKKTAGEVTLFYVYAIDTEAKGKRVGGFFQWGQDGDFDIEVWEVAGGYLIAEKSCVAGSGGLCHFDNHIYEWFVGGELAYAAAKLVAGFEGNEAAEVSGEVRVVGFDFGWAFAGDDGLDGIACDFQQRMFLCLVHNHRLHRLH